MSSEPRSEVEGTPDLDAPPETSEGAAWNAADDAMHRLLEAAFATPEPHDAGRGARFLTPFLPGQAARPGSLAGRELSAGETLGRFHIEGELGRGGFGVVYRATDTHLGRTVALKVPRPDRVQTVALWDRFAREARLAAMLDHDAIVPVLDAGVLDGVFVLVGVYQEGESLSRWLATRHPAGMPPHFAASVALRMASGLDHAHGQGVLHRDLKPSNVLMVAAPGAPEAWLPRITDFGLGTYHDDGDGVTLTGFWQGSPPYMAPEQVLPDLGRIDARSDVYALGAILYEMLTGQPIYPCASLVELSLRLGRGEPAVRPRRLRPGLPTDLETICQKCLERDPSRRYSSAAALHDDLLRFLDGRPILARPIPIWARLGRWARRRPSHAALVTLAVAASVLTAGLLARHERHLADKNQELSQGNARLQKTVAQRDFANADLKSTLNRLRVSERTARRTAFAADLRLAERELAAGRVEVAQTHLRRHEPADGQNDLRGFAWHYLMRQATRSYTVHALRDFSWWRGEKPLAATWAALDRWSREEVLRRTDNVVVGPDGISTRSAGSAWIGGDRFLHFFKLSEPGVELPRVGFNDGRHRVPLGLPWGGSLAVSRGGHILASDNAVWSEVNKAPPLIRHPDLKLPVGGADRTPDAHASVQFIEVTASVSIGFSGDDGTLACLSCFAYAAGTESLTQPLIYDLSSDWRVAYPQYQTRPVVPDPRSPKRNILPELILSRDGRLAALSGDETLLRVFETRTGRSLWFLGSDAIGADVLATCLAFSDDGEVLVMGDNSGRVRLWDATSGRLIREFPVNVQYVSAVGFHPDDRTVAIVAGNEDTIRLWNYAPQAEPPAVLDHGDEVWGLAFLDGGGALASAGDDNQIQVWDLSSGTPLSRRRESNLLSALAAAGPARPKALAFAGFAGELSLLSADARDDKPAVRFMELEGKKLRTVAWSPDATFLVTGGDGEKVLVVSWQGNTASTRLFDTPYPNVYALAFSPDGGTLAMGSHDCAITLWDVPEFRHRATRNARAAVACVAYSPDGKTLVSGDIEGGLQFWDMPEGTLRDTRTRASETGGVWALAFSPDGKTLATGGDDRMVRLWDAELGLERLALSGHQAKVHAVAFSPDGMTLASGDFTGMIRLWRAGP